ncbi:hypothetical protein C3486_08515 [Streptomyces sp. Ru73]|uniref:hypothetical protein n=1 Tax=Streptomyces sp. Ru73 TaxID=2080748 RepID=UPI000CDE20E9|nr:hypothetical protein [Streptomyces sp. Ru73]POX41710.1 hypothetical protein C3486_08515 [Streptomyces sp. Ru73]
MGDLYVVDVSLDLRPSVPEAILDDLRWQLGLTGSEEESEDAGADEYPVWTGRGPARRIGGVEVGELVQGPNGWAVTVRQEVHAEMMPEVEALIDRLAHHSDTAGVIGQIRFFEDELPELLLNDAGSVVKRPLRYATDGYA